MILDRGKFDQLFVMQFWLAGGVLALVGLWVFTVV